ncbi:MAG: hypothetical protein WA093_01995 [Minisyncoccales bacterium]
MKKIIISLAIIAAIGIGIWFFISRQEIAKPAPGQEQPQENSLNNQKTTLNAQIRETAGRFEQEIAKITTQQKDNGCIAPKDVEMVESETGNKIIENQWRVVSRDGICADLAKQTEDLQKQRSLEIGKIQKEIDLLIARPEQERAKAIQAIRDFMANQNLELEYIATRAPSNFNVGVKKVISSNSPIISDSSTMETPKEWERKAEIYQQKEYIGNTCEVYEYEIDPRNNQIIQVGVRYPQQGVIANPKKQKDCDNFQSLETPLLTLPELKEIAISYFQKGVKNFDEIKNKLAYEGSTQNPKSIPAQNTWIWQNKDYKLSDGLTAQKPSEYPTVWAIITSSGHLMMYLNTTGLFQ